MADPVLAAEQLVGLIRGDLQLRALLGVSPPAAPERDAIVIGVVAVFARYYGVRRGA